MSQWLTQRASPGDRLTLSGPMGSFYLRGGERPLLLLAGHRLSAAALDAANAGYAAQHPARHLALWRDPRLRPVKTDALEAFTGQLPAYRWLPVVADAQSGCPQRGFVTEHLDDAILNDGDVDIYLCGPPPMVNAVATALRERGVSPAGFWYEKFIASQSAAA